MCAKCNRPPSFCLTSDRPVVQSNNVLGYKFSYLWTQQLVGRDSSIGIATRYELNRPEIESRWELLFPHPSAPSVGSSLLYNRYRVFHVGKAAGVWRWPPTPSSAEVKERVELYIYILPFWAFLVCYRANFGLHNWTLVFADTTWNKWRNTRGFKVLQLGNLGIRYT